MSFNPAHPVQAVSVLPAHAFVARDGASGDAALAPWNAAAIGEMFTLSSHVSEGTLRLHAGALPPFRIANDSPTGTPGANIYPNSCLTFMSADGKTAEVLVLTEVDREGASIASHLILLGNLPTNSDLTLIASDSADVLQKFAQLSCVAFVTGTRIALATGKLTPVESLTLGDRVLTRDSGPQNIRWIGRSTQRATGPLAPVRIKAGALNNIVDLTLCPDHRLFVYQRADELDVGRSEVLIRARHLVNGDTITRTQGGFVDYVQLLFDHHQIVFAEGIAVETLLIDSRSAAAVPDAAGVGDELLRDHHDSSHDEYEVDAEGLDKHTLAVRLKRAISG